MAIVGAAGTSVWAAQPMPASDRSVTVCLETGAGGWVRLTALTQVSEIFKAIGVRIDWVPYSKACRSQKDAIAVRLSYETPARLHPGAWACAFPYSSSAEIVVFYDRVQAAMRDKLAPQLLGYVMAHEITHVLQGTNGHARTGIMKATWDSGDLFEMSNRRLQFTPGDIDLIYLGLDARRVLVQESQTVSSDLAAGQTKRRRVP